MSARHIKQGCKIFFILGLFLASLFGSALAAEPLYLKSESEFYTPLTKHLEVFVDETAELELDGVLVKSSEFNSITTKYPDAGLSSGRVWLRANVINDTEFDGTWRLDINRQYYSEILIYKLGQNNSSQPILYQSEDSTFHDRPIADRMLVVDIKVKSGESANLYIGFRSDSTTYMPVGIGTIEATTNSRSKENAFNWILNGALLAIILFTLMMLPVIGARVSVSFAVYILAGFMFVFHADGYTFQYFWPNQTMKINDPLNLTFMILMPVFGLMFSRAMFNFKKNVVWFDRYLIGFIAMASIAAFLSFTIYEFQSLKVIAYLIPPLGAITQASAACLAIWRKLSGAVPYLIGSLVVMSSFIYAFIAHMVPGTYNLDTTLDYGHVALLIECLAFAAAITIRLSGIRRERDRALNAELLSTKEKLKLALTLQQTQKNYSHARKLSEQRRDQLSSLGHDIAQPLASLRTSLMGMDGADEQKISTMHKAFDYLEGLAQSKIGLDQKDDDFIRQSNLIESFPASAVLNNVYEMFIDEAKSKRLEFNYQSNDVKIETDPMMLMRAVSNLVSNAIKHTDKGQITLSAYHENDALQICVEDTGPGMTPETIARVLQRHEKSEGSQGSGLGLAIVQDLALLMGLRFEINSAPGAGTQTYLVFPQTDK